MPYAHEVDELGYPLDPELRSLQAYLGNLAAMWRHAKRTDDKARQAELVHEYHHTLEKLYSLGWDDGLDIESELPYDLMPQEYFDRAEKRREYERQRLKKLGFTSRRKK